MLQGTDRILLNPDQLAHGVRRVAQAILSDLSKVAPASSSNPLELTILPIMTGSLIFAADLIRHLPLRVRIEPIVASSYQGKSTLPKPLIIHTSFSGMDLSDRHLLVVDDILDSGQTLQKLTSQLWRFKPASLRSCVLLRKPTNSTAALASNTDQPHANARYEVDYACFDIPDKFVVGYGLDYNGYYRNLPYIVTLQSDIIDTHKTNQDTLHQELCDSSRDSL